MKISLPNWFGGWIALPYCFFESLNGRSSLPVHELGNAVVQTPGVRVRPLPSPLGNIEFSAWRLAHAIKKADCARSPSAAFLWAGSLGFCIENAHFLDWTRKHLCLNEGMARFYGDFSSSSLAGRIAQGMALLFLESRGYAYVGRFEAEWERRAVNQEPRVSHNRNKPDFIAENPANEWILAESKGGFANPNGNSPNIKAALNKGLQQLDGWDKCITPQPIKSFAIGTFLRERGDPNKETSVLTFVDPEPEEPTDPVEIPRDAVRRANYASWLSFMGLKDAAARLAVASGEVQRLMLPVISLAGRQFAISFSSMPEERFNIGNFPITIGHLLLNFPEGKKNELAVPIVGLDMDILRALTSAIVSSRSSILLELKPGEKRDESLECEMGIFHGSILSDGSLLGELTLSSSNKSLSSLKHVEVEL